MLLGLRTAIYRTPDIAAGKLWYTKVLGFPPYFDQPFYVGFNVGGYELGLLPDAHASPPWALTGASKTSSGAMRGCSSSAPQPRTEITGRGRRHSRWPTCSILGAMCSASSKTRTSSCPIDIAERQWT